MAISTYAQLQAAAANWLVRGDMSARVPEFIALAEARLNRTVRLRLAEADHPLMLAAGARTIPLPAGFNQAIALWSERGGSEAGGERRRLRFVEPARLAVTTAAGEAQAWAVDGASLAFDRPAATASAYTLRMTTRLALSDAAPTNALLTDYPDAYLFAVLCEAAPFLRDAELAQAYEGRLERALAEIGTVEARRRAPGALITETPGGWG